MLSARLKGERIRTDAICPWPASSSTALMNDFVRFSWFGAENSQRANRSDVGEMVRRASSAVRSFFMYMLLVVIYIYIAASDEIRRKIKRDKGLGMALICST